MRHRFKPYPGLFAGLAAASILGACSGGLGTGGAGSPTRLAERSADAGDFQTAATLYQQAFDRNPGSVEALVGLGRSYAGLGQFSRAEQALEEANRRRPRDPDVLLELARTQLGAGKPQAALANLDVALAKQPKDIRLLTAKGIALDRVSRHAEAQATYRAGLQRDPTDFALLSNLGLSLGLSGQPSQGVTILEELVRDPAATANTRGNLALVLGLAGREKDAQAVLARDLSPAEVRNNLAYYRELRAMLQKGKPIGSFESTPSRTRPAGQVMPAQAPVTPPVDTMISEVPAASSDAAPVEVAAASTDTGGFVPASGGVTEPGQEITLIGGGPQ